MHAASLRYTKTEAYTSYNQSDSNDSIAPHTTHQGHGRSLQRCCRRELCRGCCTYEHRLVGQGAARAALAALATSSTCCKGGAMTREAAYRVSKLQSVKRCIGANASTKTHFEIEV
jgi:hypothetical protein